MGMAKLNLLVVQQVNFVRYHDPTSFLGIQPATVGAFQAGSRRMSALNFPFPFCEV
jgi:hypothetical protein